MSIEMCVLPVGKLKCGGPLAEFVMLWTCTLDIEREVALVVVTDLFANVINLFNNSQ